MGGIAARQVAATRILLVSYPVSTLLLSGMAILAGGPIHLGTVVWGSLSGISQALALAWYYRAMANGPLSVVSPLVAVLNAAMPVAVGVVLGERSDAVAWAGMVLAMIAVVLVSREASDDDDVRTHRFTAKVAWLTVSAGVVFGLSFVFLHQAPVESRFWPMLFSRVSATTFLLVITAVGGNLRFPSGRPLGLALVVGLLDTVANACLLLALTTWQLSLASIVVSMYSVATVILAIVVLREKVTRWQAIGLVLATVSVAMIAGG
ncbi:MAG: DMT family transporter [Mycobacteriaceae bacterium]|nr:DMT family transporter [Mycobacteriaceae bacterium]